VGGILGMGMGIVGVLGVLRGCKWLRKGGGVVGSGRAMRALHSRREILANALTARPSPAPCPSWGIQ